MEHIFLLIRTKCLSLFFIPLFGIISIHCYASLSTDSVTLYTPYSKITVPPGESIDYSIDVINNSKQIQNVEIYLAGIPRGWNYTLKSGSYNIGRISILPKEKKSVSLKVEVPLKINKGSYRFRIQAGDLSSLPLTVVVSEQGSFDTDFTTQQSNMEGQATSNFTFSAVLRNRTGENQLYAFRSDAPRGWNVTFKANYKQVTSVSIEPNNKADVTIEIDAPNNVEAGTYKIPVVAATNTTSARLDLEVVISGFYNMELTTPKGLLSTDITAGDEKRVELLVKNTGSSDLTDIEFKASAPVNWEVTFDPKKVDRLETGKETNAFAIIKADRKAIAGDYVTNIEAKTPEVSSKVSFRISVKTPILLGWIGVFIILMALGSVYYLFRKYGRR